MEDTSKGEICTVLGRMFEVFLNVILQQYVQAVFLILLNISVSIILKKTVCKKFFQGMCCRLHHNFGLLC